MKDFEGRVAVVTGAASGIGLALATECVRRGCHVVLSDIAEAALEAVQSELVAAAQPQQRVLIQATDVTRVEQIESLHEFVLAEFGQVHLLFNNAGAAGPSSMFAPKEAWQWILDLNLLSVIHGVRLFAPTMAAQDSAVQCHVVNTASIYGLARGKGPYGVTKQAVVAISEGAQQELNDSAPSGRSHVTISSLCPSFIATNIAANKAQGTYGNLDAPADDKAKLRGKFSSHWFKSQTPVSRVVDATFAGIENGQHYIHTHPEVSELLLESRVKNILNGGVIAPDEREQRFDAEREAEMLGVMEELGATVSKL